MAQWSDLTKELLPNNKTIYEVVKIAGTNGGAASSGNPLPVSFGSMNTDAFGRLRVSNPVTLYDSFHRYSDNGKDAVYTNGTASSSYNANTSSVLMSIGQDAGDAVYRESKRVFAYQPGKSLEIFMTFNFGVQKEGLRNRVGYFGDHNGVFLQREGAIASIVKRTSISGVVQDIAIAQQDWNVDTLDGTGPSGFALDLSKSQILFIDIEWLGVGAVRCGFVIDGLFVHCHTFVHANIIETTYMTTAMLPVRHEIENISNTDSASTHTEICTSVISEGGYEVAGKPRSFIMPVNAPKTLAVIGQLYPIITLRLKADKLDAISVLRDISILGIGNNTRIVWKLMYAPTITGGTWNTTGTDSSVEYSTDCTYSGGEAVASGILSVTNQSTSVMSLDHGSFKYQLERNSFTEQPICLTLVAQGLTNGDAVLAGVVWEEI